WKKRANYWKTSKKVEPLLIYSAEREHGGPSSASPQCSTAILAVGPTGILPVDYLGAYRRRRIASDPSTSLRFAQDDKATPWSPTRSASDFKAVMTSAITLSRGMPSSSA